jgi:hypothetical protein
VAVPDENLGDTARTSKFENGFNAIPAMQNMYARAAQI